MNILHVIKSIDLSYGGPSKSVIDLSFYQSLSCNVKIVTYNSNNPIKRNDYKGKLEIEFLNSFHDLTKIEKEIKNGKFDIVHYHGIWDFMIHHLSNYCCKKKVPFIISPRGMLEPWSLTQKKIKKRIALFFYQYQDLMKARCIHATSKMEAENIIKLGFNNPITIIPNGIDISEFQVANKSNKNNKSTILFLSRLHPKKGIEFLIIAWSQLDKTLRQNWQVEIAGNGDDSYIAFLQGLIFKKGLTSEISIIGEKFDNGKLAAYNRADLFVLPTYSENFGIVVAEALAYGVPVITTKGTPWEELNTHNAGWWIDLGAEPLAATLTKAVQLPRERLWQMGINGRKLVEEKYRIDIVAKQMIALYRWILNEDDKPEFVI